MDDFVGTIRTLCDTLVGHRVIEPGTQGHGGFWCPLDERVHGRSGDAILPLLYLYSLGLGDGYLDSALGLLDFIERNQEDDGSWRNETASDWKGISLFQMLSLLDAYRLHSGMGLLPEKAADRMLGIIKRGGSYVLGGGFKHANINYIITAIPVLYLLHLVTGEGAYLDGIPGYLDIALANIDPDGLITGEGKAVGPEIRHKPVDIGYNTDMSLGALAIYYKLSGDGRVKGPLLKALRAHMTFFYPDGSLDGSWCSRLYKWSMFGSKTAHGSQMAYMPMQDEDPAFARVAELNHLYTKGAIKEGFVVLGPHAGDAGEVPCIHSTFNRADSLCRALLYSGGLGATAPIPSELSPWMKVFDTVQVAVVRTGGFMGTVSGYGFGDGRDAGMPLVPTGGSISYLWHEMVGPVQVSNETRYIRHEPGNMPEWSDVGCLTPSILLVRHGVEYSNLFSFDCHMDCRDEGDGTYAIATRGTLRSIDGGDSGASYTLEHVFTGLEVRKRISVSGLVEDGSDVLILREPMVCRNADRLRIGDGIVRVTGEPGHPDMLLSVLNTGAGGTLEVGKAMIRRPFPAVSGADIRYIPVISMGSAEVEFQITVG